MSADSPKQEPEEVLDYQSPPAPPAPPSKAGYVLRIVIGFATGSAANLAGVYLAWLSAFPPFFFIVMAAALALLAFITIRQNKKGYLLGFIIAPFLICSSAFLFVFITCGIR